jgi:hypothetical protein
MVRFRFVLVRLHFFIELPSLFLKNILVVFGLLELVMSGFGGRGLMADNVFLGPDEFPHLLCGDSDLSSPMMRRHRRCVCAFGFW